MRLCLHYVDAAFDMDTGVDNEPVFKVRLAGHMVNADDITDTDVPDHKLLVIDMDMIRYRLNDITKVIADIQGEYELWKRSQ